MGKQLTEAQKKSLLELLKERFLNHMERHPGMS